MKAYYNEWLMLPKQRFNVPSIENALTFPLKSRDRITGYVHAYKVDKDYIWVPREFYNEEYLKKLSINLEYQLPDSYKVVNFRDHILLDALEPKKNTQAKAFQALMNSAGGVLSLACGKGKTVLALKYAAFLRRPVLVIVETTTLVEQWTEQAEKFLGLSVNKGDIGFMQGHPDTWSPKQNFVIGTIQSLARHADSITDAMRRRFGLIVWDECHHLSAPHYNKTAAIFPGLRLGLSATPERIDGLEDLYFHHIGPVIYRDYAQDLVPAVEFRQVDLGVDWNADAVQDEILDRTGELSWTKLWGFIGENKTFQKEAVDLILANAKRGRKILVLSSRIKTVKVVNEALNKATAGLSDVVMGSTPQADRLQVLRNKQVTVASTKLAREAIDEPTLDTLVILEPFKDPYTLRQAVGRILRTCSTKKAPKVFVLAAKQGPGRGMMFAMRKNFVQWPKRPKVTIT